MSGAITSVPLSYRDWFPFFHKTRYEMYFVLNKNRPFTNTVDGALRLISEVEEGARMKITGIVANTHLVDETEPYMIAEGIEFARNVAAIKGVKYAFAAVETQFIDHPNIIAADSPLLPLTRLLLPPWKHMSGRLVTHGRDGFARAAGVCQ